MPATILNLLFLLLVLGVGNIAYKGRTFDKTSWGRVIMLSVWFVVCSLILLTGNFHRLFVTLNLATLGVFTTITLTWILFPKLIRIYGKYPSLYLKDKEGNTRFMIRFEYPSMTIKYFEILFQQASFLFLIFVVLAGLSQITVIYLFTLIVAIIHLGNLLFFDYKWALFYFALSIPMALLFSFMISQGLVLITASIHLAFYMIFNARYWFMLKYQRE